MNEVEIVNNPNDDRKLYDIIIFSRKGRVFLLTKENYVSVYSDGGLSLLECRFFFGLGHENNGRRDRNNYAYQKMFLTQDERYLCICDSSLRAYDLDNPSGGMKVVRNVYLATPSVKSEVLVARTSGYHDVVAVDLSQDDIDVSTKQPFMGLSVNVANAIDIFFHPVSQRFYQMADGIIKLTVLGGNSFTHHFPTPTFRKIHFTPSGDALFVSDRGIHHFDALLTYSTWFFNWDEQQPINGTKVQVDLVTGGKHVAGFFGGNTFELKYINFPPETIVPTSFALVSNQFPLEVKVSPDLSYALVYIFQSRRRFVVGISLSVDRSLQFIVATANHRNVDGALAIVELHSHGILLLKKQILHVQSDGTVEPPLLSSFLVTENTSIARNTEEIAGLLRGADQSLILITNLHRVNADGSETLVPYLAVTNTLGIHWENALSLVKRIAHPTQFNRFYSLEHYERNVRAFNSALQNRFKF